MLIRNLIHAYETSGGDGGDGGATAVVEPIGSELSDDDIAGLDLSLLEPEVETPAPEPAPAAEPAAGLTPEAIRDLTREGSREAFQALLAEAEAERRAAAEAAARQPAELPAWDPFDPEVVNAHLDARLNALANRFEQALAPVLETTQQATIDQGKEAANTFLDSLKAGDPEQGIEALGDFDNTRAITTAAVYASRDGMDPSAALEKAAREEVEHVQKIEQAFLGRLKTRIEGRDGLTVEPAGGSGAASEVSTLPRGPKAYTEQLKRSMANMGRGDGVRLPTG